MGNILERVCRYGRCKHGGKINIQVDEYTRKDHGCYHLDCYQEMKDLQLFREIWKKRVSNTVVIAQLNRILNYLLDKGFSSDYLLFILNYVLDRPEEYTLNYPPGIKYYLNRPEIKAAYEAEQLAKSKPARRSKKTKTEPPKFTVKKKTEGFSSIFTDK